MKSNSQNIRPSRFIQIFETTTLDTCLVVSRGISTSTRNSKNHNGVAQTDMVSFNVDMLKEVIQDLYGLGMRTAKRTEFKKSYPKHINRENLYPNNYKILNFALFKGDGSSIPSSTLLGSLSSVEPWQQGRTLTI